MKKLLDCTPMTDSELEAVSGGSYSEIEKDLKLFNRLGLYTKAVPNVINADNFDEYRTIVEQLWAKADIQVTTRDAKLNSYTLPKEAASYKNNRAGAVGYMIYLSERPNIDEKEYL